MRTKVCNRCKKELPLTEFHKDRRKKDGVCYCCKACVREYRKMPHNGKGRKVIDMRTLQIWDSVTAAAFELKVSAADICSQIQLGGKARGRRLEYLDFWVGLDAKDKEKHTPSYVYFL